MVSFVTFQQRQPAEIISVWATHLVYAERSTTFRQASHQEETPEHWSCKRHWINYLTARSPSPPTGIQKSLSLHGVVGVQGEAGGTGLP